eukprot:SAG31_NODE_2356_length_5874_cov_17.280000_3_plen_94_part_00
MLITTAVQYGPAVVNYLNFGGNVRWRAACWVRVAGASRRGGRRSVHTPAPSGSGAGLRRAPGRRRVDLPVRPARPGAAADATRADRRQSPSLV